MTDNISNYLNYDLKGVAADLMGRCPDDAIHNEVSLTKHIDEAPNNFTPQMRDWYTCHVSPVRALALQQIKSNYETKIVSDPLLEARINQIENDKLENINHEVEMFSQIDEVMEINKKRVESLRKYEAFKAAENRDAEPPLGNKYYGGLFIVAVIEAVVNFESFLSIPKVSPFFASGLALLVFLAVAYSAHVYGKMFKQNKMLFGATASASERRINIKEFTISTFALTIAMLIVGWGRYYFFGTELMTATLTIGGSKTSFYVQMSATMLANILIWSLGVLWSMRWHDSVPGFTESRATAESLNKIYRKLVKVHLTDRIMKHTAEAKDKIEKERNREKDFQQKFDKYAEMRMTFEKIKAKDKEVLGLLNEYRTQLISLVKKNPTTIFISHDVFVNVENAGFELKRLIPSQYSELELNLKYV